jgi:hypothetical protein
MYWTNELSQEVSANSGYMFNMPPSNLVLTSNNDFGNSMGNTNTSINTQLYPNPAINSISVALSSPDNVIQLELVDAYGNIIYSIIPEGRKINNFNTEELASGIYFIRVVSENNTVVLKFLRK